MCPASAYPASSHVHRSRTVARYNQPSAVRKQLMSPTNFRRRTGIRLGQVPTFAPGDTGQALLAHHPGHPAPAHHESLTLQFPGHALSAVGRMRGMDLHHQLSELLFLPVALVATRLRRAPGVVVGRLGGQDPAQAFDRDPVMAGVDEREALTRGSIVDQGCCGLTQDLILLAQKLNLTPTVSKIRTQTSKGTAQSTKTKAARHDSQPCRSQGEIGASLSNRGQPQKLHDYAQNIRMSTAKEDRRCAEPYGLQGRRRTCGRLRGSLTLL